MGNVTTVVEMCAYLRSQEKAELFENSNLVNDGWTEKGTDKNGLTVYAIKSKIWGDDNPTN